MQTPLDTVNSDQHKLCLLLLCIIVAIDISCVVPEDGIPTPLAISLQMGRTLMSEMNMASVMINMWHRYILSPLPNDLSVILQCIENFQINLSMLSMASRRQIYRRPPLLGGLKIGRAHV